MPEITLPSRSRLLTSDGADSGAAGVLVLAGLVVAGDNTAAGEPGTPDEKSPKSSVGLKHQNPVQGNG